MSNNPKGEKHASETEGGGSKSRSGSGGGGGGKLARRARSFKEDFLEILSQMRSPSSTGGGSPHSPKARASSAAANHSDSMDSEKNPIRELEAQFKQVQYALKHFRDVVSKNKLEVLPGNGTVVLETVTNIHSLLKTYVLDEQSSALVSATSRVHQSVARLIKLCDDVLLHGDDALDPAYVQEVIHLVEEAVQNLVTLAQDKLTTSRINSNNTGSTTVNETTTVVNASADGPVSHSTPRNDLVRATVTEIRCPSLPDIPLTPRERLILEQTSIATIENHRGGTPVSGHGFEYRELDDSDIDGSPPPKPPLPGRFFPNDSVTGIGELAPPPLPPKRRQQRGTDEPDASFTDTGRLGADILSRSPEDTSSLLSASAGSLDSVLNHSREEEEIQALMDPDEETTLSSEVILPPGSALNGSVGSCCCWEREPPTASVAAAAAAAAATTAKHERLSSTGDSSSGFASMHSLRSSTQSYTASSSVQMTTQHTSQHSCSSVTSASIEAGNSWLHRSSHSSHTSQTMTTTSTTRVSSRNSGEKINNEIEQITSGGDQEAPALPNKTRSRRRREVSQYDNVPDQETWQHSESTVISVSASCSSSPSHGKTVTSTASVASLTTTSTTSTTAPSSVSPSDGSAPPPLPLKKKHIMAYMEMFGNCSQSQSSTTGNGTGDFLRHSVAFHAMSSTDVTAVGTHLSSAQSCSFDTRTLTTSESTQSPLRRDISGLPPALPPKRNRQPSIRGSPRPTTPPQDAQEIKPVTKEEPILPISSPQPPPPQPVSPVVVSPRVSAPLPPKETISPNEPPIVERTPSPNPLDELDITRYLVLKRNEEDGPDVRGGHPDALIILATKANKNDFSYQEAFLTTYRTFISPIDLIDKLCYRQRKFQCTASDIPKQRAARETFSLLVRVVNDLTVSDLDDVCVGKLMEFVYQLLCSGDLTQAKALRVKILEKYNAKRMQAKTSALLLPSLGVYTRQSSLLEFKPEQIAEQMTLLDRNLFIKIEIPEVLVWAREQNEERSPHLTRFTEHFNKMSYWARSRILEQAEAKERERYVVKFIKIMKHLRKLNNFNSYLALLSALDSAPIRRLEWHKHITEGLKEYCALIDSSSSFRAYRQALADTQPPCIPYIGLVLQDLTFVHIGNNDLLTDGSINFSKRWQQYHIVENMKRFQKGEYNFKRHERILAMFNNFDDFLCEEAMWQISETIKPRGARPPANAAS